MGLDAILPFIVLNLDKLCCAIQFLSVVAGLCIPSGKEMVGVYFVMIAQTCGVEHG